MSLSDLKNKGVKAPKQRVSVEEFIEQANAYAKGRQDLIPRKSKVSLRRGRRFKKATFTLSPANIEQLSSLAESAGIAKSKMLRQLIETASARKDKKPR